MLPEINLFPSSVPAVGFSSRGPRAFGAVRRGRAAVFTRCECCAESCRSCWCRGLTRHTEIALATTPARAFPHARDPAYRRTSQNLSSHPDNSTTLTFPSRSVLPQAKLTSKMSSGIKAQRAVVAKVRVVTAHARSGGTRLDPRSRPPRESRSGALWSPYCTQSDAFSKRVRCLSSARRALPALLGRVHRARLFRRKNRRSRTRTRTHQRYTTSYIHSSARV